MTTAKKRALASQYEQTRLLHFSKVGRSLALLFASILSFALISLIVTDQILRPDTFVVEQLKIKGKFVHAEPQRIERAIREHGIGNFFSVELDQIKRQVEKINWVRTASVRREWPDTLVVTVDEHRPAMKWGETQWLNTYGEIIDVNDVDVNHETVTLSGEAQDSNLIFYQALRWQSQLAQRNIELNSMHLSESHAWRLHLQVKGQIQAFELLIGREDVDARFQRFLTMYEKQFAQQATQLIRVDARYPNGLATISEPFEPVSTDLLSKI